MAKDTASRAAARSYEHWVKPRHCRILTSIGAAGQDSEGVRGKAKSSFHLREESQLCSEASCRDKAFLREANKTKGKQKVSKP